MFHFPPSRSVPSLSDAHPERLVDWLVGALRALPFILGLLVLSERPARAYTDPGTGALVWQMAAAAFVGFMFYLRKFISWLRRSRSESSEPVSEEEREA